MRRIAILGFDTSTARLVPPQSEGWEHWRCNMPGESNPPVADRWFQLHERYSLEPSEEAWVPVCPVPLYTFWPWPDVRNNRVYPLAEVCAMPGVLPGGFFACTFAYEIALACWEHTEGTIHATPGVMEIGLYGVELPNGSARERTAEYGSVAWWAGYAAGLGITVTRPKDSALLRYPHPYGYEYAAEVDFVRGQIARLQRQLNAEAVAWRA